MKALVVRDINRFAIEDVDLDAPRKNELKVHMHATGVCHSDLSIINGTIPVEWPLIIGHEGAGIVIETGPETTGFEVGDHVVLSFIPFCGDCFFCRKGQSYLCVHAATANNGLQLDGSSRVQANGEAIRVMGALGCMAEYAVVPAISAVRIDPSIPLDAAALVGCAVTTGVGAVHNTASVEPDSSVAVVGCGGVGMAVIQGARIAGASTIVAIDKVEQRLEAAKHFGATHTLVADDQAFKGIKGLTQGLGVDYAFEAIGNPATMELAYAITRNGGKTVVVGVGSPKERVSFNALTFSLKAKEVCGCMYGNAHPPEDFPRLLELYQSGKLDLDGMITQRYTLDQAHEAFNAMRRGENTRGLIVFN